MRGTKDILGNIENQYFDFGEEGNEVIYFRGTREQVPGWEGLKYLNDITQVNLSLKYFILSLQFWMIDLFPKL